MIDYRVHGKWRGGVNPLNSEIFQFFCLDLQQTRGYLCNITLTGTNSAPKIESYAWMCVYLIRVYGQVP